MSLEWKVLHLVRNETSTTAHVARQLVVAYNQWAGSSMCTITFVK